MAETADDKYDLQKVQNDVSGTYKANDQAGANVINANVINSIIFILYFFFKIEYKI
jgi:hypothetical protein